MADTFVPIAPRPAPVKTEGLVPWARANLFGNPASTVTTLALLGLFLWALPGVIDYIAFLWRERTPVLSLRLDFVYACFAFFVVAVVVRSIIELFHVVRPGWRRHV